MHFIESIMGKCGHSWKDRLANDAKYVGGSLNLGRTRRVVFKVVNVGAFIVIKCVKGAATRGARFRFDDKFIIGSR